MDVLDFLKKPTPRYLGKHIFNQDNENMPTLATYHTPCGECMVVPLIMWLMIEAHLPPKGDLPDLQSQVGCQFVVDVRFIDTYCVGAGVQFSL